MRETSQRVIMQLLLALSMVAGGLSALEEAPYTVVQEHDGWEERDYPPTRCCQKNFKKPSLTSSYRWVSSEGFDMFVHDGHEHSVVFRRLFNYIDGGNSEGMKIPMTAPVSIRCHSSSSKRLTSLVF